MRILLFGATGMVGDGVLRAIVDSPMVDRVVTVTRKPLQWHNDKIDSFLEENMFALRNKDALRDFDACFYCLGASSIGMNDDDYRRLTYDLTLAVVAQLLPANPRMVFLYISGEGADLKSRQNWGRVKAETELALSTAGFRDAYSLRPGYIQPMRGSVSRERWMRVLYGLAAPIYPFLQKMLGRLVTSTDLLAAAMLRIALSGNAKKILNNGEINAIAMSGHDSF